MARLNARVKEDKQPAARDKYARDYAGSGKPTTPAPATPTPKAGQEATPAPKAKEKPKAKPKADAAPVLPSPQTKQHAKGKGKGKGTPRGTSRSASPSPKDKKEIPCHFHFAKQSCKKGNDCEYSHDQKVFENNKKGGGKHLPTPQRRLMNRVGIGQKASASLVIHVEGVMTPTCSTPLQIPATQSLRHWYMTLTAMMM